MIMSQVPELRMGHPVWWHGHGTKMQVEMLDLEERRLVLSGSAAKVTVTKSSSIDPEYQRHWMVNWNVIQSVPDKEGAQGGVLFSRGELAAAFMLTNDPEDSAFGNARYPSYGEWVVDDFGGDSAAQGRFIRWGEFLNIPCPGTGHDGDPNVSVLVDEAMKEAIRSLLA